MTKSGTKMSLSPPKVKPARQVSEPGPEVAQMFDLQATMRRQVSAPEPDGRGRWSSFPSFSRENPVELLRALHQNAIQEKRSPPWLLIAGIVFFNIIGKIGDAIGPAIVGNRPVELLLLNASNTHCILTTTTITFLPWIIIGSVRRFCEDPIYFYAGWRYREACLGMLKKWCPDMAEGYDKAEDMFRNNLYVAVAVNPGATVCSLAGASKMPPAAFFALNVGSTVAQLLVMRYICSMFPDNIDYALSLIGRYMKILLAIMVGITLFGALPMLRKKKEEGGELATVAEGNKKDD